MGAPPESPPPEHLLVGRVLKAHALGGEVLVRPITDRPGAIFRPGRALFPGAGDEGPRSGAPPLEIEAVRSHNRGLLVKFAGREDRTAAERLAKRELFAATDDVEPPAEDELFYHELLGLEVATEQGARVGRISDIYDAGPTHLLEVEGEGEEHLIPFAGSIVVSIELDEGRMTIAPPPGLLEV